MPYFKNKGLCDEINLLEHVWMNSLLNDGRWGKDGAESYYEDLIGAGHLASQTVKNRAKLIHLIIKSSG